jgi:D-glycero-alpha-D-manno-heptose-7-phosphate kinase
VFNDVEIHYDGDLPGRSGMGSSSSFTVGLLNALATLEGKSLTDLELAEKSTYIEQKMVGERVGSQDQVAVAYGGFNHVRFLTNGSVEVNPIVIAQERKLQLEKSLMLFFTGISRTAAQVAETYTTDIKDFDPNFQKLHQYVDYALEIVRGVGNLDEFGSLLHDSWLVKRSLSPNVSNSRIDDAYDTARRAGALGGKITGAGGGGMLLLYVPRTCQEKVKEELSNLLHIPFSFESSGSQIIYPEMSHRSWQVPTLLEENIHGFNVIGYDGFVYAIHQSEGAFEISRVQDNSYAKVFQGLDVETIEKLIKEDKSSR